MRYVDKLVQNSERYEYHKIQGNHLLHMTNPEGTASLLKKFILDITEPVSLDSLFDNFNKFQSVRIDEDSLFILVICTTYYVVVFQ